MAKNSFITLTFGDMAENHVGMEQIGKMVEKGQGFDLQDLQQMSQESDIIYDLSFNKNVGGEKAFVLVIKNGIEKIGINKKQLFQEHII
jgi:hypothetical protein